MSKYLNTTTRTITWFKKTNDAGELQIKPPFQRNPVWVTPQKQYLIDSIIDGYPIPEIYMQEYVDEAGNEKHVIIDGQQRIRACLEYIEGRYGLDPEQTPAFPNMLFDDLPGDIKKTIFGYTFHVRILPEMPDEEIRGIFQRLNKNVVALNAQELRQATYCGKFIFTVQEIANYSYWNTSGIFTPQETRRMLDIEFISELSIAVLNGLQNKKEKLDEFYQLYEESFDQNVELTETFQLILFQIEQIFPNLKTTRWRKKTDFYTLFLYLAENKDFLPLSSEKLIATRDILTLFANKVTLFVSNVGGIVVDDPNAEVYAKSLRASSDLGNRKRRQDSLKVILDSLIKDKTDTSVMVVPQDKEALFTTEAQEEDEEAA